MACTDADDGPMEGVCDAVGLRVFQSECGYDEVCDRARWELLVLDDDVLEEGRLDLTIVPPLLEVGTVQLLRLDAGRDIGWIDLPHEEDRAPSFSSTHRALHLCSQAR